MGLSVFPPSGGASFEQVQPSLKHTIGTSTNSIGIPASVNFVYAIVGDGGPNGPSNTGSGNAVGGSGSGVVTFGYVLANNSVTIAGGNGVTQYSTLNPTANNTFFAKVNGVAGVAVGTNGNNGYWSGGGGAGLGLFAAPNGASSGGSSFNFSGGGGGGRGGGGGGGWLGAGSVGGTNAGGTGGSGGGGGGGGANGSSGGSGFVALYY
jgi:hypothetical protein